MPLPPTVSCSSKIQIGFTFLVPAHLGSPEQRAVKWMLTLIISLCFVASGTCLSCLREGAAPLQESGSRTRMDAPLGGICAVMLLVG